MPITNFNLPPSLPRIPFVHRANGVNKRMFVLEKTAVAVNAAGLKVGDRIVILLDGTDAASGLPILRTEVNTAKAIEAASFFASKFGRGSVNDAAGAPSTSGAGAGGGGGGGSKRKAAAKSTSAAGTGGGAAKKRKTAGGAGTPVAARTQGHGPAAEGAGAGAASGPGAAHAAEGREGEGAALEGAGPGAAAAAHVQLARPPPIVPGSHIAFKALTNYDCSSGRMVLNRAMLESAIPSINTAKTFMLQATDWTGTVHALILKSWQNGTNKRVHVMEGIGALVAKHGLKPGDKLAVICETNGAIRLALNPPQGADLQGGSPRGGLQAAGGTGLAGGAPGGGVLGLGAAMGPGGGGSGVTAAPGPLLGGPLATVQHCHLPVDLPARVPVTCGGVEGVFLPHLMVVAVRLPVSESTSPDRERAAAAEGAAAGTATATAHVHPVARIVEDAAPTQSMQTPPGPAPMSAFNALPPPRHVPLDAGGPSGLPSPAQCSHAPTAQPSPQAAATRAFHPGPLRYEERHITLPEFERLGGRQMVRKWKETVSVVHAPAQQGIKAHLEPLGVWLSRRDLIVKGRTLVHVEPDWVQESGDGGPSGEDDEELAGLLMSLRKDPAVSRKATQARPVPAVRRVMSASNLAAALAAASRPADPQVPGPAPPGTTLKHPLGGTEAQLQVGSGEPRQTGGAGGTGTGEGLNGADSPRAVGSARRKQRRGGLPRVGSKVAIEVTSSSDEGTEANQAPRGASEPIPGSVPVPLWPVFLPTPPLPAGLLELKERLQRAAAAGPGGVLPPTPPTQAHTTGVEQAPTPLQLPVQALPTQPALVRGRTQEDVELAASLNISTDSAFQPFRSPPGGASPALGSSPAFSFLGQISPRLQHSKEFFLASPRAPNRAELAAGGPSGGGLDTAPPPQVMQGPAHPAAAVLVPQAPLSPQDRLEGDSQQSSETHTNAGASPPLLSTENPLRALQNRLQQQQGLLRGPLALGQPPFFQPGLLQLPPNQGGAEGLARLLQNYQAQAQHAQPQKPQGQP